MEMEKHVKRMKEMLTKKDEEINEMYNSGMFNKITEGYLVMVLKKQGYENEDIVNAVVELHKCQDEYTAGEARANSIS